MVANGSSRIISPDSLEVSQRLAHVPRYLYFPDGSMFTTLENEQLDDVLRSLGIAPKSSWINFFESGWRWTWLALIVIPVVLYLLFSIGMPLVAGPIASWVPETVKDDLDERVLEFLDQRILEPSHLEPERKAELHESFSQVSRFTHFEQNDLKFRSGGIVGANAFALPGGTIIFTDEIVELAEDDGELVAVFAHERGHVVNNHSMRNLMQSAGVTFVLGWMLGDLTMITDVVLVGAPTLLQQMSYSRSFEREADEYALTILKMYGYSSNCFADMMQKLATQKGRDLDSHSAYLSSHPSPRERIEASRSEQACSERLTIASRSKPAPDKPVQPHAKRLIDPIEVSPPEISEAPEVIDMTEGDYHPIKKTAPAYPREALMQGVEGYCVVEYTVTDQGKVKNPRVLADQCTSHLFVDVSLEAALKFRYKPRVVDSHAEDVKGIQNKFTFEITSSFVPYRHEE
ncbi:MAG: TonB family protein [Gammaproteobacteria bacterium]|nr:TonB family protein [Gammaproteobacteria bacterium]